jgi:hypothetical protein
MTSAMLNQPMASFRKSRSGFAAINNLWKYLLNKSVSVLQLDSIIICQFIVEVCFYQSAS